MASLAIFDQLTALETKLRSLASTADAVKAQVGATVEQIGQSVTDATKKGATALDDFIFLLEQKVKQGDYLATVIKAFIADVEAGNRRIDEAQRAFGDITVDFQGQVRNLGTLLADLLGGAKQTFDVLHQGIDSAKDWKQALEALTKLQTQAAQSVVPIFKAFQEGKVTLDFLLSTLQQLRQKTKPGDSVAQLGQLLADAARQGLV